MRGLLSSTLSHAQVCSTIVDRISSGLPIFPYYVHFSIQSSLNWDAKPAVKSPLHTSASFFCLSFSTFRPFMSFLYKASSTAQLKASSLSVLKGSTSQLTRNQLASTNISPARLLWFAITVPTESTSPDWGWHRTFQMAVPLCCPSTQTQARPYFVVIAQSPAFWSTPVMLPWCRDSSFSLRHYRVRQSSSINQRYTTMTHSWQPPSPLKRPPAQAAA